MTNNNFERDVMYKLGSIEKHLENLNGATEDNKKLAELTAKKVVKHDMILGKIGIVFIGVVFVATTAINFSWDFLKSKF